ncbi:MAG: carboxylating nicotinate-nucleotide diphosphorylase [Phycisphaerales bacterium]
MRDLNTLTLHEAWSEVCRTGLVTRLLELARDEDLGSQGIAGDITSATLIPRGASLRASLVARDTGVIAGLGCVALAIDVFKADAHWSPVLEDGVRATAGASLGVLEGEARHVLALERTILNLVGRLSGVATMASAFVNAVQGSCARIYDTRKTTAGMRLLEKHAVRSGGAMAHRVGLYDAVLIKDNHLAGLALDEMADRVREASSKGRAAGARFVEVEVDSIDQLDRLLALEHGVLDVILLDNFSLDSLREAVSRRNRAKTPVELEASGGVRLDTVGAIAQTGVERISAGAITHSARTLDVALDAV